ncbi:MAG: sugar nucleotide-binding protein [Candidatus Doudnabacteria bacterium]|nr:sugar nucleotide-binding protein [Candidatus Doudnabacteria bacterium]
MQKPILITGASGYVGAGIYQYLKDAGLEVSGTYHATKLFPELIHCDITDQKQVAEVFEKVHPAVVIHIAANGSNATCEEDPEKAIDLNVNATKYLAEQAARTGAKFIFISSFAAYNPRGVYGESKIQAERYVEQLDKYMILRPSLVVGWSPNTQNDRPFNRFVKDLEADKKVVEYDSSWQFNATFLSHLSQICKEIVLKENYQNTVVPVASNHLTSRYELARAILSPFGVQVKPVDKKANIPEPEIDWTIYQKLDLPTLDYDKGIAEIISKAKVLYT